MSINFSQLGERQNKVKSKKASTATPVEMPENIRKETRQFTYTLNDAKKNCITVIQDVCVADINGKTEILDEDITTDVRKSIIKNVINNQSKYSILPSKIILTNKDTGLEASTRVKGVATSDESVNKAADKANDTQIIESYAPKYSLDDVALNSTTRDKVRVAISAMKNRSKLMNDWGMEDRFAGSRAIILNFYGKAGTGKSMTGEAIASALGKKVYHVNYSELESKYVGETPKNIKKAFEAAKRDDAVLIFDEADSFLGKRLTSVTQSADYGVNITRSVLLIELEKFNGVVIFTTNLIDNYDEAFKRRIFLSIYFDLPDVAARESIWKLHINPKLPLAQDVTPHTLANKYSNISGADIKDIVYFAALNAAEKGLEAIDFTSFDYAYDVITERYKNTEKLTTKTAERVIAEEHLTEDQFKQEVRNI